MNKNTAIKIRLSEEELQILEEKASLAGYNKSKYIRSLINDINPKSNINIDYQELIHEFNIIAKSLTEIELNNKYNDEKIDVTATINDLDALIKKIDKQLRVPDK